jgi:peptide/nickel transport system substrate-binding protein
MIDRTTKLRWRRRFRRRRHQVEDISFQAEEGLERHLFKRLNRLAEVRRFVISWILLFVLLIGGVVYQTTALSKYYESLQPVPGGTFTEGILGSFTNANPIYATGPVDSAVSHLIFSSLLKYDSNNQLVSDLADNWSLDTKETTYTVKLKKDLHWQDGAPLTAQDVVFTYHTIQDPDAKSPLLASWQGIKIDAKDDETVVFTLPNALSAFPHSLTSGIIPAHILSSTPAAQMRATRFNTVTPVGAGPFKWNAIELSTEQAADRQGRIGLLPNDKYHDGTPKLSKYIIRFYANEKQMLSSFENHELTAMSGIDTLPDTFKTDQSIRQYNIPLTAQVMVFFRNSQEILSDVKVRQALVEAVDQNKLLEDLGFPVIASREPFLKDQPGYNPAITQLGYDATKAGQLLTDAGWVPDQNGIRTKNGKQLTFKLYSQSTSEYAYVTQKLQSDWQKIGVKVDVMLQADSELQNTVAYHAYDALLYGISLGPDPDAYAYWGSTQADQRAANRVNFSEYKSTAADKALEGGRTRTDPALRTLKYKPFLEAWRNDAPALALYQPRYLYVTRDTVHGFNPTTMNVTTDRYADVVNWMIHQEKVRKT